MENKHFDANPENIQLAQNAAQVVIDLTEDPEKQEFDLQLDFPGFNQAELAVSFKEAMQRYTNLTAESFQLVYEQLPKNQIASADSFLDVSFEDLFKVAVVVRRSELTIVRAEVNAGATSLARLADDNNQSNKLNLNFKFVAVNTPYIHLETIQSTSPDNTYIPPPSPPPVIEYPYTPSITLNSGNTANMNREGLIPTMEVIPLSGNIFQFGASYALSGVGSSYALFDTPWRSGSTIDYSQPGEVVLTTPEGNYLTFYTANGIEHVAGDFVYTLMRPIFTPPESYVVHGGSKVFTENFQYMLTGSNAATSYGQLKIEIIDDVPTAVPKTNDAYEVRTFVNGFEAVIGNLISDDDGFGVSTYGADGGHILAINGETFVTNNVIEAATTYGSIAVVVDDDFPEFSGDYIYNIDNTKTIPLNDALMTVNDVITYQLIDNDGNTSTSNLTVTIHLSQAPIAHNDNYSLGENQYLMVSVGSGLLANDTLSKYDVGQVIDINGDPTLIENITGTLPSGAGIYMRPDGSFDYDGFSLFSDGDQESFTYTVENAEGLTSTATVTIDFTAASPNPILQLSRRNVIAMDDVLHNHSLDIMPAAPIHSESVPAVSGDFFLYVPLDLSGTAMTIMPYLG